jgi:hypothetical protein
MPRTSLPYLKPTQIGFAASSGPVEDYFPLAQQHHVSWLEFGCQNPVNFPQTFDRERIRRVRRLVERSEIRCGLHSASFVNSAEIMPTVRKAATQHLKDYIELAAASTWSSTAGSISVSISTACGPLCARLLAALSSTPSESVFPW